LLGVFAYKQKTVRLQAKDLSVISKRPFGYKQKPSLNNHSLLNKLGGKLQ